MRPTTHSSATSLLTVAAIPFLLLSSSQEAGIVTRVNPDGSGERLVYARSAVGRAPDVARYLTKAQPACEQGGTREEAGGQQANQWRWVNPANLDTVGEAEAKTLGVVHEPLSMYTKHTWQETVTIDRGDATDIEVQGQAMAQMTYIVRMPGSVTSHSPVGEVDGNKVTWTVLAKDCPKTFKAESRTFRWGYVALWAYVLLFLLVKIAAVVPRIVRMVPRKPRKI